MFASVLRRFISLVCIHRKCVKRVGRVRRCCSAVTHLPMTANVFSESNLSAIVNSFGAQFISENFSIILRQQLHYEPPSHHISPINSVSSSQKRSFSTARSSLLDYLHFSRAQIQFSPHHSHAYSTVHSSTFVLVARFFSSRELRLTRSHHHQRPTHNFHFIHIHLAANFRSQPF